jgi:hypothetical protein
VAIKYLATVREDLEYRRLLIFEDKDQEDAWATEFLTQLDSRIRRSLYVLLQPPLLPSSTWSVMTLANLLLYHKDQYYLSLIGFGEMGQRSFSITFSSRPAYQVLGAFFDSLVSDASVTALSSLEAYASARHNYYVAPNLRSVLATFIKGATHNENVLHEGAFGKHALTLNQVRRFAPRQEHESDYVWPLRSFSSLLQHPSGAGDPG